MSHVRRQKAGRLPANDITDTWAQRRRRSGSSAGLAAAGCCGRRGPRGHGALALGRGWTNRNMRPGGVGRDSQLRVSCSGVERRPGPQPRPAVLRNAGERGGGVRLTPVPGVN